jgi:hypothetical protein
LRTLNIHSFLYGGSMHKYIIQPLSINTPSMITCREETRRTVDVKTGLGVKSLELQVGMSLSIRLGHTKGRPDCLDLIHSVH